MNSNIKFSSRKDAFKIGSCKIKIPEHSLNKGQEVDAKVKLCINRGLEPPKDYVQASSTLICDPALKFRNHACIIFPTWFNTDDTNDIDVTIFEETERGWKKVDTLPLTNGGYIEMQVKKLNNITAFLSKKSLPDVKISLKSYLFKKGKRVRACVGPNDEIFDRLLISEMEEIDYSLIKKTSEKRAYGEKLPYLAADTKMGDCGGEASELNNFVEINEAFLDLKATPIYDLTERESRVIVEEIPIEQPPDSTPKSKVEFRGDVDANNIINTAEDIYIDQRSTPSQQMDSFTVDGQQGFACGLQINLNNGHRSARNPVSSTLTVNAGSTGATSSMTFHGNVKVRNIVGSAKNVTIDQGGYKRPETQPPQSVEAEGDIINPIQVEGRSDDSHSECGTIEETARIYNSSSN